MNNYLGDISKYKEGTIIALDNPNALVMPKLFIVTLSKGNKIIRPYFEHLAVKNKVKINLRIYLLFSIFSSKLSVMTRQLLVSLRKYKRSCFNYARMAVGLPKIMSTKEMSWHKKKNKSVEFDFEKIVSVIEKCRNKMDCDGTKIMIELYEKKYKGIDLKKFNVFALNEKLDLQMEKLCIYQ